MSEMAPARLIPYAVTARTLKSGFADRELIAFANPDGLVEGVVNLHQLRGTNLISTSLGRGKKITVNGALGEPLEELEVMVGPRPIRFDYRA